MAKKIYQKAKAPMAPPAIQEKVDPQKKEDEDLLKQAREGYNRCAESESTERTKMKDDLRFVTLDQWPADVRSAREDDPNGPRPCLTSDEINQYVTQVENDMRHNRASIKPRPVDDKGDPATAEIFAGLIRHIEDKSNAEVAYVTAGGSAVRIGLGYFRITTEYVPGSFNDQEPRIVRIPNTFSVYLGAHINPDGSDAEEGWIIEEMPLEKFKREFPKAKCDPSEWDGINDKLNWRTEQTVTVCEYFYIEHTKKKLLFLADGSMIDADKYDGDENNIVDERETSDRKVRWCKMTAVEILEKGDWLGKYIPIVEVVGKEQFIDGKRVLWGLVRPAKDMLRMKNYWLSAATEKIALSPKAPFVGAVGQFATDEESWRKANFENRAFLQYDAIDVHGNAIPPPERVQPAPVEMAIINMLGMIEHDVQKSLGMFKASLGESSGQQSGKAILALEHSSDIGTYHFQDNLNLSIAHCGRILIDLIPKVIDTRRALRILGEDGQSKTVTVDPAQSQSMLETRDSLGKVKRIYSLNVGEYDVTVTSGPSYSTGRQEAATILTDLANSAKDPASAAVMRYLAIKNSDFHGSDEMVKALRVLLPPPVQAALDGGDQEPIPAAALAKISELTQTADQLHAEGTQLMQENQQLKSGHAEAMAKIQASSAAADADRAAKERAALDEKAFQEWKAKLDAETKVTIAHIGVKGDQDVAMLTAEANAETALSETLAGDDGAGPAPMRPLDRLASLHEQGMAQHSQSMDQLATGLTQALSNIGTALQRQTELLQAILTATTAPKRTSISGVQKDAAGNIIGATVSSAPARTMQ